MTVPLLWLSLLALTADRALAVRTVTQSDPNNSSLPLLHWPTLKIRPYRTKLQCYPTRMDSLFEDVYKINWFRNDVIESTFSHPFGQTSTTDPFYRFKNVIGNHGFAEFSGSWKCQWQTKVIWQNNETIFSSPFSPNLTIDDDERPLDCGVPWQNISRNIPMLYNPRYLIQFLNGEPFHLANLIAGDPGLSGPGGGPIRPFWRPSLNRTVKRGIQGRFTEAILSKNNDHRKLNFGKIANGITVDIKTMPWVVHIRTNTGGCSGAFLSSAWVITATHCLLGLPDQPPAGSCMVYGGTNRISMTQGRPCKRIYKYPDRLEPDIALIALYDVSDHVQDDQRFSFRSIRTSDSSAIYGSSICLPSIKRLDAFDKRECYVASYGQIANCTGIRCSFDYQRLNAGRIKIEGIQNSIALFRAYDRILSWNATAQHLVRHLNSRFTFAGPHSLEDSGSPIFCNLRNTMQWQLAGIFSHGIEKCVDVGGTRICRHFHINAERVSAVKGWINTTMTGGTQPTAAQLNFTCSENDYRCGPHQCVPHNWLRRRFMRRARRTDIALFRYLRQCKTNLVAAGHWRAAYRFPHGNSGFGVGSSSSEMFFSAFMMIHRLVLLFFE